jgi:hypothetical protein
MGNAVAPPDKAAIPWRWVLAHGLVSLLSISPGEFRPEDSNEHVDELKNDSPQQATSAA